MQNKSLNTHLFKCNATLRNTSYINIFPKRLNSKIDAYKYYYTMPWFLALYVRAQSINNKGFKSKQD